MANRLPPGMSPDPQPDPDPRAGFVEAWGYHLRGLYRAMVGDGKRADLMLLVDLAKPVTPGDGFPGALPLLPGDYLKTGRAVPSLPDGHFWVMLVDRRKADAMFYALPIPNAEEFLASFASNDGSGYGRHPGLN